MRKALGFSVYLSAFEQQKKMLSQIESEGTPIFTSLHIGEEFGEAYTERATEMCQWLARRGFYTIADISPKTLAVFDQNDPVCLARQLGVSALRPDYGFGADQIGHMVASFPLVINASTAEPSLLNWIREKTVAQVSALHNFYPRPETGLDEKQFVSLTRSLQERGIPVYAFIAGDEQRRGPLMEGLPTVEKHRNISPLAACVALLSLLSADAVFLGDIAMTAREREWIHSFMTQEILPLPVTLNPNYRYLYGKLFTCRPDSPTGIVRFVESRAYASSGGKEIVPEFTLPRKRGNLTIDNARYLRYSGEIQLMRCDYPEDHRVNVIGELPPYWHVLMDCIQGGTRFCLVDADRNGAQNGSNTNF